MNIPQAMAGGAVAGVIAGFASGLLGVSPGGILVPVISLVLGFGEHLAQAVSLVAQAPPTSLSGISDYSRRGRGIPIAWIIIVSLGFLAGSPLGAALTSFLSNRQLRWGFVGYLVILAVLAMTRGRRHGVPRPEQVKPNDARWLILVLIGLAGGISSGLLGIGGGLAVTTLSVALIGVSQHEAQALSLMVTALPLTLPAAWVYVRQGIQLPWWEVGGIIAGLAAGNKAGAMVAIRMNDRSLRFIFIALIVTMAIYMAISASHP